MSVLINFFSFSQKPPLVSARTDRCLSNLSEVIVETGPLFNGKISVENSTSEECAVYGNRSIAQEAYHLTILHDRCGSKRLVRV